MLKTRRCPQTEPSAPDNQVVLRRHEQAPAVLDVDLRAYEVQIDLLHLFHALDERVLVRTHVVRELGHDFVLCDVDSTDFCTQKRVQFASVRWENVLHSIPRRTHHRTVCEPPTLSALLALLALRQAQARTSMCATASKLSVKNRGSSTVSKSPSTAGTRTDTVFCRVTCESQPHTLSSRRRKTDNAHKTHFERRPRRRRANATTTPRLHHCTFSLGFVTTSHGSSSSATGRRVGLAAECAAPCSVQ